MGFFRTVFQYVRLLWIYLLHGAFMTLLLTRVLADEDWSWFYVFAPLFLWDALAFLYCVLYVVSYATKLINAYEDEEEQWNTFCFPKQNISIVTLLSYAIGLPLKMAAEILLCFHLSGSIRFYFSGVILCLLFVEVGAVLLFYSLKPAFRLLHTHYC